MLRNQNVQQLQQSYNVGLNLRARLVHRNRVYDPLLDLSADGRSTNPDKRAQYRL